jgi:ADP-L-glycero-D-manno-heptose 6-epimerase
MISPQKTYLVTGAAGFIGSRFIESCNERKIATISVDRISLFRERIENRDLNFGRQIDLEELLPLISTKSRLTQDSLNIDAIIHLGAITDTRESDPLLLKHLNLEYTKALWQFATQAKLPFIYASSAATYGDGAFGYDDQETYLPQLKPLNAYGDSKHQFDLWALRQESQGSHPSHWCGFKFFNVYGFGERHKGFMSSVVLHAYHEILETGKVTLFKSHRAGIEDGFQKRDFIFVEDVVHALHFAISQPITRGIYNLGTGQARTFLDLAKAVFLILKKPVTLDFIDTPEKIRDKYQYFTEAKMTRIRQQGYQAPFTCLEEGVEKYVLRLEETL